VQVEAVKQLAADAALSARQQAARERAALQEISGSGQAPPLIEQISKVLCIALWNALALNLMRWFALAPIS
jgi:hypothetical protein